jgi:dihydropteroate synthase
VARQPHSVPSISPSTRKALARGTSRRDAPALLCRQKCLPCRQKCLLRRQKCLCRDCGGSYGGCGTRREHRVIRVNPLPAVPGLPQPGRTLVVGVVNVTPDSFSDGGEWLEPSAAISHGMELLAEGADIIDVGGESTRPGSEFVSEDEELRRVIPIIERLASSIPISIDTTKASVARVALEAGAEIVNDISGLRFEPLIADEAARANAGLILMHSRGVPKTMQQLPRVDDIVSEVIGGLRQSVATAEKHGVNREAIAIDPGLGFGMSGTQNVEVIARLSEVVSEFADLPLMIGPSRKSFLGKLLDGAPADQRLYGTIASVTASVMNGAHIVRVHDVKATVETVRVADAIREVL